MTTPMPDFHVIIPARYASSRLPAKALADIGGQAMVVRVAEQAKKSGAKTVNIATDDARIADAVHAAGFHALMTSSTHQSGTERLHEACQQLGLANDAIVVNVQGDEPFIAPKLITAVAQTLAQQAHAPMASACHAIDDSKDAHNPNIVKVVMDAQQQALYFSRAPIPYPRDPSAHAPASFYRHIGLYAYRVAFLQTYLELAPSPLEHIEMLEQLRVLWHGHRIALFVSEEPALAGVDTPEDLLSAQRYWQSLR